MVQQPSYWKVFTRRKVLPAEGAEGESKLNRVLGLYDLTALGVGSTLGAGVYVLAGQIARDQAGPSVMLSFAIAALASLLAGVCYAEFGARVPKAGSAYVYSYVCIGEFAAFVIGWNLILEYVIGTASVCRGISLYLDTLINDTLKNTFAEVAPINVSFLGSYFDFFAFGLVVVFGVALAFGVETSTMANNFCTCLNICILLFVIIAGSIKADFANWNVDVSAVNETHVGDLGAGGFFPFGFAGTLKGAATCFFGFVGFDCIATTGEEVRNPRRNIPRSILLSLLVIFLCYFGVSTVLTLMVPYYLQDPNAPLPYAFKEVGWMFAMWIVSIGGLVGLLASLFGALFPLPRVMYSMAEDGLLFRFLGKISPRYQVPVVGSICAAIITALIAGLFNLDQLVNLLSIGTLLAYSVVAISVTILRYMDNSSDTISDRENGNQPLTENSLLTSSGSRVTFGTVLVQLFNCKRVYTPNTLSTRIVGSLITAFCLLSLGIGLIFMQAHDALIHNQLWVFIVLGILIVLTCLVLLSISLQPREAYTRIFRVPLVPLVPAVSIFINIYLMLQLDVMTWIRFGIWMIIGIPMFIVCWCKYDIKNPEKRNPKRVEFERLLKESSGAGEPPANGHLQIENIESKEANLANGNLVIARNEHSVKSLDEIMNMNEVSDELVEVKHANGKIFYVEDTKSNTSASSLEKSEECKLGFGADTSEEEKSVIAMLDDVLQAADDGALPTPHIVPDYSRKFSVDSEMLPSVIETTTVAMVHSSSDSSEKELDDLPEVEQELWMVGLSTERLNAEFDAYTARELAARKLVDDILNSEELWRAVHERKRLQEMEQQIVSEDELAETAPMVEILPIPMEKLKRSASAASILSTNSAIDDALHSEKFKNKLSQLIMQPPAAQKSQKFTAIPKEANETACAESDDTPTNLKHSKSETDVRRLVLKAIEGTGLNPDNDSANAPQTDADGIPKPPKFDPILYKTINSLSFNKERPGLDKLLIKDKEPRLQTKIDEAEELKPVEQVPFKLKLEAILQRGPSHRTQQKPHVSATRPKSMSAIVVDAENHYVAGQDEAKRYTSKSQINLTTPTDPAAPTDPMDIIKNTRKSLKHVESGLVES